MNDQNSSNSHNSHNNSHNSTTTNNNIAIISNISGVGTKKKGVGNKKPRIKPNRKSISTSVSTSVTGGSGLKRKVDSISNNNNNVNNTRNETKNVVAVDHDVNQNNDYEEQKQQEQEKQETIIINPINTNTYTTTNTSTSGKRIIGRKVIHAGRSSSLSTTGTIISRSNINKSSIAIGSSINISQQQHQQHVQSSIPSTSGNGNPLLLSQQPTQSHNNMMISNDQNTTTSTTTTSVISTNHNNNKNNDDDTIIPYQHLGQLNPAWNIPPSKNENDKPMKFYCSKYISKLPIELRGQRITTATTNNNNGGINGGGGGVGENSEEGGKKNGERGGVGTATTGATNNGAHNNNGQSMNTTTTTTTTTSTTTNNNNNNNNININNDLQDNRSGPMVEIINGEIVIKESTIIIGRRHTTEEVDRELDQNIIIEDNNALTATYRSFTNREQNKKWNAEETKKFYKALRQCGTDFTTMENFFRGEDGLMKRSRKQLKGKYMVECRKNWKLIDMAMNPKVQMKLDLSVFGDLDMSLENLPTTSAAVAAEGSAGTLVSNISSSGTSSSNTSSSGNESGMAASASSVTTASIPALETHDHDVIESETKIDDNEQTTTKDRQDIITPLPQCLNPNQITQKESATEVTPAIIAAASSVEDEEKETQPTSHIPLTIASGAKKKKKPKFRAKAPVAKGKAKKTKS